MDSVTSQRLAAFSIFVFLPLTARWPVIIASATVSGSSRQPENISTMDAGVCSRALASLPLYAGQPCGIEQLVLDACRRTSYRVDCMKGYSCCLGTESIRLRQPTTSHLVKTTEIRAYTNSQNACFPTDCELGSNFIAKR